MVKTVLLIHSQSEPLVVEIAPPGVFLKTKNRNVETIYATFRKTYASLRHPYSTMAAKNVDIVDDNRAVDADLLLSIARSPAAGTPAADATSTPVDNNPRSVRKAARKYEVGLHVTSGVTYAEGSWTSYSSC